jgi:hypothetical protein
VSDLEGLTPVPNAIDKSVYSGYVKASVAAQIAKNRIYLQANAQLLEPLRFKAEELMD